MAHSRASRPVAPHAVVAFGSVSVTRALGLGAAVVTVALLATGFGIYGHPFWAQLLATVTALAAETALVLLVLDHATGLQVERDWEFVRQIVGQRMAAAMVDIMRLCGVRFSPLAFSANKARYDEFAQLAELHLQDLRSNLEGLALRAKPEEYREARRIELHLAWLCRYLHESPSAPTRPSVEQAVLAGAAESIRKFLVRHQAFRFTIEGVEQLVGMPDVSLRRQPDAFWQTRLSLQQRLLDEDRDLQSLPRGIIAAIDGTLALRYFAIDAALIASSASV